MVASLAPKAYRIGSIHIRPMIITSAPSKVFSSITLPNMRPAVL